MFNGYEMWKPDVERCTRYRLTNARGSACGRCMKTCPINKVVDADGAVLTRAASWLGVNAMFLKPLMVPFATWFDDCVGNGRRNPAKKWWLDHEIVGGVVVTPRATNERDIDPERKVDPASQKMAYYHADMMPPPNDQAPCPVDRKAAMAAKDVLETPAQARARHARGGAQAGALHTDAAGRRRRRRKSGKKPIRLTRHTKSQTRTHRPRHSADP